jgi:hypothetical protein
MFRLPGLGSPLMTVVRALFENFVGTYWASQAEENGRVLLGSAKRELMRVVKLNLTKGHAGILHRDTGQDHTREFLRDPRLAAAGRLPQFAHMAEGAGIRKIYDQLYGVLSLLGRASGADILANRDQGEMIRSNLHAAITFLRCAHLILSARIKENRVLSRTEIEAVTKVALA